MLRLLPPASSSLGSSRVAAPAAPCPGGGYVPRLIVKFHPAPPVGASSRVAKLALDTGMPLTRVRTLATGAEVLTSPAIRNEADADRLVASLARRAGRGLCGALAARVRGARPERSRSSAASSISCQLATAIDASSAWDVTLGSAAIVVAVLDTGSTPHADLAGRLLPGWDFVSDPAIANDGSPLTPQGDSRDADAADPGDYVTGEDIGGALAGTECSVSAELVARHGGNRGHRGQCRQRHLRNGRRLERAHPAAARARQVLRRRPRRRRRDHVGSGPAGTRRADQHDAGAGDQPEPRRSGAVSAVSCRTRSPRRSRTARRARSSPRRETRTAKGNTFRRPARASSRWRRRR